MNKVALGLVLVALGASCAGSKPELLFVYEVTGRGGTVDVTYLSDDGLVEEEVTVPWTSEEMPTTPSRDLHVRASGSPGDKLRCELRWRLAEGRYGEDGSGSRSHTNDPEDAHRCRLDDRAG